MLSVVNVVFCEKAMLMADNKYFLAGILPGKVHYHADSQVTITCDIFIALTAKTPGTYACEFLITGPDGRLIAQQPMSVSIADMRQQFSMAFNNVSTPLAASGDLKLSMRQDDGDLVELGSLALALVPQPAVTAQFGQAIRMPALLS